MSESLPTSGVTSQIKKCFKCEIEKPLTDFHRHKKGTFGVQALCKVCRRIYDRAYYATSRGRQVRNAGNKRYSKTSKGIAANKRYVFSDKGRLNEITKKERYDFSEKGLLTRLLYRVEARDNNRRLTG